MKKLCMPQNFPNNLKNLRLTVGMSQKELGKIVGRGQNHISYWEHGKSFPGIEALLMLSEALSVSIDCLLFYPDDQCQLNSRCKPICLDYKHNKLVETRLGKDELIKWRRIRYKIWDLMAIRDEQKRKTYLRLLDTTVSNIYRLASREMINIRPFCKWLLN